MKRINEGVAGRSEVRVVKPDVAGQPGAHAMSDVASLLNTSEAGFLSQSEEGIVSDADLVEEFAEFLEGGSDDDSPMGPSPDPIFRERLRHRLWRMHLLLRPPDSLDPH